MSNNLAPVIEELRRAFTELKPHFDEHLGDRRVYNKEKNVWEYTDTPTTNMPMPVITVQARGRKRVDGWYKPKAWEDQAVDAINALVAMGGERKEIASRDEICIAAEALNKPNEEILLILTGQMLHHWAKHNNQGVLQNENGYHTKSYAYRAQSIGINAEADGSRGYCDLTVEGTQAGRQLTERFKAIALDPDVFDMHRIGEKEKEFKGSKLKKWSCGCTNIRAAVYVEAVCSICSKPFEYADKDKDSDSIQDWLQQEKDRLDNNQSIWGNRDKGRKAQ